MTIVSVKCGFVRFVHFQRLDPFWIVGFLSNFLKDLHFIIRSLKVMRRAFHDFNCDVISIFEIFGKPDSWEMPPSKFLYKYVSVDEHLTDMAWMIAANFIIFNTLIFAVIFFIEVENEIFESSECKKKFTRILGPLCVLGCLSLYDFRVSFWDLSRNREGPRRHVTVVRAGLSRHLKLSEMYLRWTWGFWIWEVSWDCWTFWYVCNLRW
jgi:hypothetical protein